MDMIPLKPERKTRLEEYAKRRGQDPAAALDDALASGKSLRSSLHVETVSPQHIGDRCRLDERQELPRGVLVF
jgi:hypothetical protein